MTNEPPTTPRASLDVHGFDRTVDGVTNLDHWSSVASTTLKNEGISDGRLDVIFVEVDEMATLNQTHMGHSGPTDVLAFPLDGPQDPSPRHLGDVVVCPAIAAAQAPDHCGSEDAELTLLIVHGVLHVLGHDHAEPEQTTVMRRREMVHLAGFGFEHPEPV